MSPLAYHSLKGNYIILLNQSTCSTHPSESHSHHYTQIVLRHLLATKKESPFVVFNESNMHEPQVEYGLILILSPNKLNKMFSWRYGGWFAHWRWRANHLEECEWLHCWVCGVGPYKLLLGVSSEHLFIWTTMIYGWACWKSVKKRWLLLLKQSLLDDWSMSIWVWLRIIITMTRWYSGVIASLCWDL